MNLKRIICHIRGCDGEYCPETGGYCERCGAAAWKSEFVSYGATSRIRDWYLLEIRWRFDRLVCWIFGCEMLSRWPDCRRCSASEAAPGITPYATRAITRKLRDIKHRFFPPKCDICGRRMKWDDNLGIWDCGIYDDDHMPF